MRRANHFARPIATTPHRSPAGAPLGCAWPSSAQIASPPQVIRAPILAFPRRRGLRGQIGLCWRYTFADPRTAAAAEALSRLTTELASLFADLESAVNAGSTTRAAAFLRSGLAAAVLGGVQLLSAGCDCGGRTSTDAGEPAFDAAADAGGPDAGSPHAGPTESGTAGTDAAPDEAGVPLDAGACTSPVTTDPATWLTDNVAEPCVTPVCGEVPITFDTDATGTVVAERQRVRFARARTTASRAACASSSVLNRETPGGYPAPARRAARAITS